MPSQLLLLIAIPRGVSLNPGALPVSVMVSPRLGDGHKLGEFPDWLHWTQRLKEHGIALTLACGARSVSLQIATDHLRPDLWQGLFNANTLVRPFVFDDYSERAVFSFPVRLALSAIKGIYQAASLDLTLPERGEFQREQMHRRRLASYLEGLDLRWDARPAASRRADQRGTLSRRMDARLGTGLALDRSQLGRDGLIAPSQMPEAGSQESKLFNRAVVEPFGVYHHMPLPESPEALESVRLDRLEEPDWANLLDFHQVLGSLQNYFNLQRALGLVFDLNLPDDFVPAAAAADEIKEIAVAGVEPGWEWDAQPVLRPMRTAVIHEQVRPNRRLFSTAPAAAGAASEMGGGEAGEVLATGAAAPELEALGLLNLDPTRFGLAQVDVDGAVHKAIVLSEMLHNDPAHTPAIPPHPEVFDSSSTLPSLRSGGFSLFADARALDLMRRLREAKTLNAAIESGQQAAAFRAEDLVRGYRLEVWDSRTIKWHSLHKRKATYKLGGAELSTTEEGFVKLLATQAAPDPDRQERADDLYLHESIARWAGWSLSVPFPGSHLSRFGDPHRAFPEPGEEAQFVDNEAKTPFKMTTSYEAVRGSLPQLRFGARYRFRALVVDLAGNSVDDDAVTDLLSARMALPFDPEGFAYLRFEPVAAPVVILRDERAITEPGGELDRIVIRTFNDEAGRDSIPARRIGNDRHVAPPRTSVEIGERMGMFDDEAGRLIGSPQMWDLIARRDEGEFRPSPPIVVAGKEAVFPLEPDARLDHVPYLPDPLARGAAFRDLPGAPPRSVGKAAPGVGGVTPVSYRILDDPNPRPGSATLVDFGGDADWQQRRVVRFALEEGNGPPSWDPLGRVLTVFLPKGHTAVVAMSSFMHPGDLKLMGIWEWLREFIEDRTRRRPSHQRLTADGDVDAIAHVLQRAVEGGHWMLTPPRLITLVHAVQQPLGVPRFVPLIVQRAAPPPQDGSAPLETALETGSTAFTEFSPITAWRRLGSVDAFLLGGLHAHLASTVRVDLSASWTDPVDNLVENAPGVVNQSAYVDEIPIADVKQQVLASSDPDGRKAGYCVPSQDLLAFVKRGDALGSLAEGITAAEDAAPRHVLNDTRHHRIRYTATSTSRYREYFSPDRDFTRRSEPIEVDVPASARPLAPDVAYIIPTFGWQRQVSTSLKRSVRLGGGLRVYLNRPWFSSGEGELLGVVLWSAQNGTLERQPWKPFITQWGLDPVWETAALFQVPFIDTFTGFEASASSLTLEENTPTNVSGRKGVVDVVGYPVHFDAARRMWFADITITTWTPTYMPFVRLALARFQPHALRDAMLSRVVLGDFVQLTPDRSAAVTADPSHPRRLRVTVSGPAPRGPRPEVTSNPPPHTIVQAPTEITISVQQREGRITGDLAWSPSAPGTASIAVDKSGPVTGERDLTLWSGTVLFTKAPAQGRFRLLIEEHEYVSSDYTTNVAVPEGPPLRRQPGRLIYAETVELDGALVAAPEAITDGAGAPSAPEERAAPPDAPYGPFGGPASDLGELPQLARVDDPDVVDGHVKLVQALLNAAGILTAGLAPLRVDGNYGQETENAVKTFQTTRSLPTTGRIDPMTWYALLIAAPFARLEGGIGDPPMQGPPITALQELLNVAAVFPRAPVNGMYDEETADAVQSFQAERGLPLSGIMDPATWLALTRLPDVMAAAGSMILTFAYEVIDDPPLTFVSRTASSHKAPASESLQGSAIGRTGFAVELRDQHDEPIYRRTLHDPFNLQRESPAPGPPNSLSMSPSPPHAGMLRLLLPNLPHAVRLVFIGSPLNAAQMHEPGDIIAAYTLADLV